MRSRCAVSLAKVKRSRAHVEWTNTSWPWVVIYRATNRSPFARLTLEHTDMGFRQSYM